MAYPNKKGIRAITKSKQVEMANKNRCPDKNGEKKRKKNYIFVDKRVGPAAG